MDQGFVVPKRAARRSGGARELARRVADTLTPRAIVFDENLVASYVSKPLKDGELSGPVNRFTPLFREEKEGVDLDLEAAEPGAPGAAAAAHGAAAAAPGAAPAAPGAAAAAHGAAAAAPGAAAAAPGAGPIGAEGADLQVDEA